LQSLNPDLYGIEYDENGKIISYTIRGEKYDYIVEQIYTLEDLKPHP
jgi:hypothetical protein